MFFCFFVPSPLSFISAQSFQVATCHFYVRSLCIMVSAGFQKVCKFVCMYVISSGVIGEWCYCRFMYIYMYEIIYGLAAMVRSKLGRAALFSCFAFAFAYSKYLCNYLLGSSTQ
jgi:membrane-bound acyltransferase YfiQ involved in biofilm formation